MNWFSLLVITSLKCGGLYENPRWWHLSEFKRALRPTHNFGFVEMPHPDCPWDCDVIYIRMVGRSGHWLVCQRPGFNRMFTNVGWRMSTSPKVTAYRSSPNLWRRHQIHRRRTGQHASTIQLHGKPKHHNCKHADIGQSLPISGIVGHQLLRKSGEHRVPAWTVCATSRLPHRDLFEQFLDKINWTMQLRNYLILYNVHVVIIKIHSYT